MARDEPLFLNVWVRYYGRLFGDENLFVIDDHSSSPLRDMTVISGINVVRIPFDYARTGLLVPASGQSRRDRLDGPRFRVITNFVRALCAYYDVVVFNDVDELFVAYPERFTDLHYYFHRLT